MASNLNAITTGIGGIETAPDNSGILHLQSDGITIANVHSSGVGVTGSCSISETITAGNASISGTISVTNGWAGTGTSANVLSGIPQVVTVERGGVGTTLTGLAYGNGSSGNGMRMPFNGKIVAATLHCTDLNGTWSAYLEVNGSTNASYALSATAATADAGDTEYFSTPYSFSAGDAINWQQQSVPTGCTTSVISFWIVFD